MKMNEQLSANFNLSEFLKTSTGLDNTPSEQEIENLRLLCVNILQPVREKLGIPITVTSGYRSPAVNKAVGGSATSYHSKGMAADLKCNDSKKLFNELRSHGLFAELIYEFGDDNQPQWVHVAYDKNNTSGTKVLRARKVNGRTVYERI